MIVKSLRLKNIRSYQDKIIAFPTGSVLLSGDIGSGKSTILLAVEFALFGTDLDRLSSNALLRKDANEGFVELNFQVKNQDITIKRTLKRGKKSIQQQAGHIVTNGVKKDLMPAGIKAQVIELLGYPPELASKKKNYVFRYTVYTPQEDMKEILTDDEESRLNTLRKIFNMDKYKRIRENTLVYVKELKSKRREFEIKIENLEELKKQLRENQEELQKNTRELNKLIPRIENQNREIQSLKEEITQAEEKIKWLNEQKKQLEVLQAQERVKNDQKDKNREKIEKIKQQLSQTPIDISLEDLQNKIESDEKLISEFSEKKTSLNEKYSSLQSRIEELQKDIETHSQKIKNLSGQRQKADELKQKIEDIQDCKNKKQELEKSLQKLTLALKEYEVNKQNAVELKNKILQFSKCPTCHQIVPKEHKENISRQTRENLRLFEKRIAGCQEQEKQNQLKIETLSQAIEKGFEHEKEYERIKAEIRNLEEYNRSLQQKIDEFENKKNQAQKIEEQLSETRQLNLEEKQKQLRQNRELLEKARERKRLESELKELESSTQEIIRDIHLLLTQKTDLKLKIGLDEKIEEDCKKLKKDLEQHQEQKQKLAIEKTRLDTQISHLQNTIESLTQEIENKNKIKEKLSKIKQTQNWLNDQFLNLMTTIEKHVMARIQLEFNELFQEWFSMLIEDENITAKLDDRFNPVIEQNGYEIDLKHLSGGERTSIALAYRLALNKVVNDVISSIQTKDLLILDEPTDGFSSQQLDKVRDVLDQLGVKQTIIVSHENKIESFVDNVIKIHKREGVSEVL